MWWNRHVSSLNVCVVTFSIHTHARTHTNIHLGDIVLWLLFLYTICVRIISKIQQNLLNIWMYTIATKHKFIIMWSIIHTHIYTNKTSFHCLHYAKYLLLSHFFSWVKKKETRELLSPEKRQKKNRKKKLRKAIILYECINEISNKRHNSRRAFYIYMLSLILLHLFFVIFFLRFHVNFTFWTIVQGFEVNVTFEYRKSFILFLRRKLGFFLSFSLSFHSLFGNKLCVPTQCG